MSLMLAVSGTNAPAAAPQQTPGGAYRSTKTLAALQECLTDKLSTVGEVVALTTAENATTLLVRDNPEGPMTIDLVPGTVTVTSKFITGSQKLVKDCL